jgi:hypothetical protein
MRVAVIGIDSVWFDPSEHPVGGGRASVKKAHTTIHMLHIARPVGRSSASGRERGARPAWRRLLRRRDAHDREAWVRVGVEREHGIIESKRCSV